MPGHKPRPPHRKPAPLGKLQQVTDFNQRVHIDLLGKWPEDNGNTYLLVIQDAFSKWVELYPLPDKTAEATAAGLMKEWIHRYGIMHTLVSDQGKEFVNTILSTICRQLGIAHQTTSALHPQSNGLVERTNRTIINFLHKY